MNRKEIFNILYDKDKIDIYNNFKEIESNIEDSNELYQYFDDIKEMLLSDLSYVRVRGLRLICKLSKWDSELKINKNIDILLNELDDPKPTNVRQCLSALNYLLLYKRELSDKIEEKLLGIDLSKYKDSMGPLIKKDIDYILNNI